jgi:hypothetical protein
MCFVTPARARLVRTIKFVCMFLSVFLPVHFVDLYSNSLKQNFNVIGIPRACFMFYCNDEDVVTFKNAAWFFFDRTSELGVVFYRFEFSYSNYD